MVIKNLVLSRFTMCKPHHLESVFLVLDGYRLPGHFIYQLELGPVPPAGVIGCRHFALCSL